MADVEKVITDLELIKASIEWEEPLDYQIMLDNAIQTIKDLQEDCKRYHEWGFHEGYEEAKKQIPKWHLCEDELPKDNIKDVLVYLKNGATIQASWSIFGKRFRVVCEHGIHEVYEDNPVIAWMELPKFEEVE